MDNPEYVWLGVFVIGLVLVALAVFRKTSTIKVPPAPATVIGVIMMVLGFMWGVSPMYQDSQPLQQGQTQITIDNTKDIAAPTFSLDPETVITNIWDSPAGDVITTQTLNSAETVFTVPLNINEVASTSYEFVTNFTAMNFTVTPIPPVGANADDLATIYFETEYDITYNGEYVFVMNDAEDIWFANWTRVGDTTDTASWNHAGQDTMLLTDSETYQVAYKFDSGINDFCEEMATVGDTCTWTITFHNADWSWSKVYTVNAITVVSA